MAYPAQRPSPYNTLALGLKRALDLTASTLLLLIFLPLLVFAWVLVRRNFGSPAIFSQIRPGLGQVPFRLYKFRTMTNEADAFGNLLPDEVRLTPAGQMIRKFSLDELPQFLNVIKGEMSLVGPRPLLMQYLDRYTPEQARRYLVRPGITGLAQIRGRNNLDWEAKFALDTWYVDNWSLSLDLKILALTAWKVILRDGISSKGSATMHEFMGSGGGSTCDAPPILEPRRPATAVPQIEEGQT